MPISSILSYFFSFCLNLAYVNVLRTMKDLQLVKLMHDSTAEYWNAACHEIILHLRIFHHFHGLVL